MPYRPTERTEQRKAEARERIVAAAMDQLADGGYQGGDSHRGRKPYAAALVADAVHIRVACRPSMSSAS